MHGLRRNWRCNDRFSLRVHQHLQQQCKARSIWRYGCAVRAAAARLGIGKRLEEDLHRRDPDI